ncbi:MAG: FliG C-terminal domain-containing protein [Pseudomonadota bacterium]
MTPPDALRGSSHPGGLRAVAQLLRAAGSGADMVFAQLTPGETRAIHQQMDHLPTDHSDADRSALEAFLLETAKTRNDNPAPERPGVWGRLSKAHAPLLAALAGRESPQVSAWLISQLDPQLAAGVVRMLSEDVSLAILKRILNAKSPPKAVCDLIETSLAQTLDRVGTTPDMDGHARLARIFDQLDPGQDSGLLTQLDASAPGAGERVRALMFTFDDLVALDAAGMQTLIAATPRETLIKALKASTPDVSNAFYSNLTRRAGALIREEIEAMGPIRASDVQTARAAIVETARQLIHSGDILLGTPNDDDELVE